MKPLRLTWTLQSPMVVSAHPLHLDALVAYAMFEEALRNADADADDNIVGRGDVSRTLGNLASQPLPLGRAVDSTSPEETWCWQASAILPLGAQGPHSTRFWTRKTDPYDYSRRVAAGAVEGRFRLGEQKGAKPYAYVVDTQRGIFKQQYKFFPMRHVTQVQAWCIGDEDQLVHLLSPETGYVTHLGGKARMGFGRIGDFTIEYDSEAEALWQRRVLPWAHDGAVQVEMAVRPPYWAIDTRGPAWVQPDLL